jgi:predicted alpha/beta superfamily hydrolase
MIRVLEAVPSPQLGNTRDLYVYLPPSYPGGGPYRVIYMQDGQNLFDPALSFAGSWRVDRTLDRADGRGLEAIVVGIANAGESRIDEYGPWRHPDQGGGRGDDYLAFVSETVKPLIDQRFPTLPRAEHTGIAGSSLGGLIAVYAFLRFPDRWGFAAGLSPSVWFAEPELLELAAAAGPPHGRR